MCAERISIAAIGDKPSRNTHFIMQMAASARKFHKETPLLVSNDQFIFQIEFHCTIMTSAAVNNTAGVKSF